MSLGERLNNGENRLIKLRLFKVGVRTKVVITLEIYKDIRRMRLDGMSRRQPDVAAPHLNFLCSAA